MVTFYTCQFCGQPRSTLQHGLVIDAGKPFCTECFETCDVHKEPDDDGGEDIEF